MNQEASRQAHNCSFHKQSAEHHLFLLCRCVKDDSLSALSYKFLDCARSSTNHEQNETLIHTSWHLSKCEFLFHAIQKENISPSSYINYFASFVFSSALSLEQIYRYHSIQSGLQLSRRNFHNLLELHLLVLRNVPIPKAVHTYKLAINWACYFYINHYDTVSYSTFHKQDFNPMLAKLVQLASTPENTSLDDFRKEITRLDSEVRMAVKAIGNFLPVETKIPKPSPYIFKEPLVFQFPSFINLTQSIDCKYFKSIKSLKVFQQLETSLSMLEDSITHLQSAKQSDEFNFWAMRCLFLTHESTDLSLRILDYLKNDSTIANHDIAELARRTNLDLTVLSPALAHLSLKLKYPASTEAEGLGSLLIDQLEALRFYPELNDGAEIAKSALVPEWKLPLKDVTLQGVINNLSLLMTELHCMLANQVLPEIGRNLQSKK